MILANVLGTVSATYLLCLNHEGFLTEQEQILLQCFRETDDRGRETILGVVQSQPGAARN